MSHIDQSTARRIVGALSPAECPEDYRVDTYSTGRRGFAFGKINTTVRVTHLPSGIVEECNEDRSQHRNRQTCLDRIAARLAYDPPAPQVSPCATTSAASEVTGEYPKYMTRPRTLDEEEGRAIAFARGCMSALAASPVAQPDAASPFVLSAFDCNLLGNTERIPLHAIRSVEGATLRKVKALAASAQATQAVSDQHAFKNFHRSLCARFGYMHDEKDWRRDLVSLEEHIARQIAATQAVEPAHVAKEAQGAVAWMQSKRAEPPCAPAAEYLTMTNAWKRHLLDSGDVFSIEFANSHDVPLVRATPPAPASPAEPSEPDMRAICEALGFDPTNHHNAAKCPYCHPASTTAQEAEPERQERDKPCPNPGCNAHWGITCGAGHMRLKDCPHWTAAATSQEGGKP